jgi:MOSC domain-containing protein YiiM
MNRTIVESLLVGALAPLGPRAVPSGIDKKPVAEPVFITRTGIEGDAQGDLKNHGGPEKAVHHYPLDHYAIWRAEYPELEARLAQRGAFGENLSSSGLTEAGICIGDVYRFGTALLQVAQGRQPCWKLNERFGRPDMARLVQESGRTGWYYRVMEEGHAAAGEALILIDRPTEAWPVARVLHVLYRDTLNRDALSALAALPWLAESWRTLAARRLERNAVEDWSRRLQTAEESPGGSPEGSRS